MILDEYVKGYMPENEQRRPKLTIDYLVTTFDSVKNNEQYVGAYIKPPYVVIDVDNHNNDPRNVNAFKRVLEAYKGNYIWWNTSTGVCALFKLPKQLQKQANGDVLLACGIPVEYKSSFNKNGEIGNNKFTIKKDGKIREPIQVGQGVDELPKELYAIKFNFTNSKGNTLADGKDDSGYNIETYLNNFQMPCMSVGMTDNDVRHVIDVINNFVLTKKRDDIDKHKNAIEQQRVKVNTTGEKTRDYAHEYVEENQPFNLVVNCGKTARERLGLYTFDGCTYSEIDVNTISNWIYNNHPEWDTLKGDQAFKYIQRDYKYTNIEKMALNYNKYTPFLNGVLDTKTGKFTNCGNKPEHMNTLCIRHKYIEHYEEDDTSRLIDNFMYVLSCGDNEIVEFLWMWLGLCLAKSTTIDKILFMYGSGENLKSYFMSMVENAYPTINRPIKRLGENFGCQNIDNGYVIQSTEMFEGNMSDIAGDITRQLSSQDTIAINGKNLAEYQNRPIGKMMYATNCEVKLGTGKNAKRRTLYVPFNWNANTCESVDSKLLDKLELTIQSMKYWLFSNERVAEYVLHMAVNGLRRYLNSNKELRYDKPNNLLPQSSIELTKAFNMHGDTVGKWVEANKITSDILCDREKPITRNEWYNNYKEWVKKLYNANDSHTNEYEAIQHTVKSTTFYNQIISMFNLSPDNDPVTIEGKQYRIFKEMK
nr:MAG TPA: DNA helicase [Caudoviricetes sp.]